MNGTTMDSTSEKQDLLCGREGRRADSVFPSARWQSHPDPKPAFVPSGARRSLRTSLRVSAPASGFTLFELLVVVALIVSLAGGIGLALRKPSECTSLQSAQAALSALLGAARGRAALSQQNACCMIAADPSDAAACLHFVRVVEQDPANSSNWLAKDDGVWLADGVYVVPPAPAGVPGNPAWPASRRSTALPSSAQSVSINGAAAGLYYPVQFTPRGTTGGGYLLLTVGHFTTGSSGPVLTMDDSDNVRGVLIRSLGALTLVNDAGALGQ
jgi:prepilin-type N-terminal cleavage/methylation domain-containing protein